MFLDGKRGWFCVCWKVSMHSLGWPLSPRPWLNHLRNGPFWFNLLFFIFERSQKLFRSRFQFLTRNSSASFDFSSKITFSHCCWHKTTDQTGGRTCCISAWRSPPWSSVFAWKGFSSSVATSRPRLSAEEFFRPKPKVLVVCLTWIGFHPKLNFQHCCYARIWAISPGPFTLPSGWGKRLPNSSPNWFVHPPFAQDHLFGRWRCLPKAPTGLFVVSFFCLMSSQFQHVFFFFPCHTCKCWNVTCFLEAF